MNNNEEGKKGRKPIKIIESNPLSNIIFLIASGENYAQVISKYRKAQPSPTVKQLKVLEKKKFISSKKEALLNKTIYSVNWNKIISEFMRVLKEQRDRIIEQDKALKSNLPQDIRERYNLLEDKEFLTRIRSNEYLTKFLEGYFSVMAKTSRHYSLFDLFGYIAYDGNFDFVYSTAPNLEQTFYFLEQQNRGHIPKDIIGMSEKEWKEKDKEQFDKHVKENLKNIHKHTMENFESSLNLSKKRTEDILKKDKDLSDMVILTKIIYAVRFELALQSALNQATQITAKHILRKYLSEEELNRANQYNPLTKMPKPKEEEDTSPFPPPQKKSKKEQEKEIKEAIDEVMEENGLKATNPTENKEKKTRNTNQNEEKHQNE